MSSTWLNHITCHICRDGYSSVPQGHLTYLAPEVITKVYVNLSTGKIVDTTVRNRKMDVYAYGWVYMYGWDTSYCMQGISGETQHIVIVHNVWLILCRRGLFPRQVKLSGVVQSKITEVFSRRKRVSWDSFKLHAWGTVVFVLVYGRVRYVRTLTSTWLSYLAYTNVPNLYTYILQMDRYNEVYRTITHWSGGE